MFGRIFIASLLAVVVFAGAAQAECPPFPKVPWWKHVNHKNVIHYVAVKYGGDWTDYIDKWEKQYAIVQDVYERNSVIVVTKDKIRVEGDDLKIYLGKLKGRVAVIRCLARESAAAK